MSLWTDIRDTAESVAVVVGNYYVPGSSLLTSKLASKGSQEQLSSDIGQIAQIGSSIYGVTNGPLFNPAGANGGMVDPVTGANEAGMGVDYAGNTAAATANPSAAAAQTTDIAAAPLKTAGTEKLGTWDKVSGYLEKNPVVAMMGANLAISGMAGIETAKVAREKAEYERQQRERELGNLNAPTSIPLRAKPYKPLGGIINGRA